MSGWAYTIDRVGLELVINQVKGLNLREQYPKFGAIDILVKNAGINQKTPLGYLVNCIAPGFIKTNISSAALDSDPERKQKVLSRTPMGELGLPEDIANTAYFFATDQSRFMTGTIIPVDGGNSIGFK